MISSTGLFLIAWLKIPRLQKKCDQLSFGIPMLGKLLRLATLTYWCRTLGHLLESGLALPDSLRVTAQSSNHWLSHDFSAEVFKQLARGWPLGDALIRADPQHVLFGKWNSSPDARQTSKYTRRPAQQPPQYLESKLRTLAYYVCWNCYWQSCHNPISPHL